MTDELHPHPESPHQRMLDFLAESDQVNADIVPTDPDWPALEKKFEQHLGEGLAEGFN